MRRRLTRGYTKLFLITLIPGVVLPVFFFILFSVTTKSTGRDILPSLSSPAEVIGCFGFALTGFIFYALLISLGSLINSVHQAGLVIPLFDSLSAELQSLILISVSLLGNTLVFFVPLALIRALLHLEAPSVKSATVEVDDKKRA